MHFCPRFNQMVSLLTNYRRHGKFTDSLTTNYRHPFVFQELQTKNVVDIKQLPYYENINYNESNIIKKWNKTATILSWTLRSVRNQHSCCYHSKTELSNSEITSEKKSTHSLACRKKKKRDFRRLAKQFSLDKEDNFTILKKTRITRSE